MENWGLADGLEQKSSAFLFRIALVFNLLVGFSSLAQVGIGTTTPQAALEVVGSPTNTTVADGLIPPRMTGDQLKAKTYTSGYVGAVVYVTSVPATTNAQTVNVTRSGYYYFDGTKWMNFQRVFYGSFYVGDVSTSAPMPLTTTGFISQSGGSAVLTHPYPLAADILITHNLGLTTFARVTIGMRSNSTSNVQNYYESLYIAQPIVHDVTPNSFRILLQEKVDVTTNMTIMIKLID